MKESNMIFANEIHLDEERLKKITNTTFNCKDCKNNLAICFICKTKGAFYSTNALLKANKSNLNKNNENDISEEENENKQKLNIKSDLVKCSIANCNKFYHLDCLKNYA